MTKIVINAAHGGFNISAEACKLMREWGDEEALSETMIGEKYRDGSGICDIEHLSRFSRDNPNLVRVVEKLGEKANGPGASLLVVEIPNGVEWEIQEYDGAEWVAERHRTWP
jgi:hypothetical protein